MRLQSLYTIRDLKYSNGEFSANLSFDPDHKIFLGHFPGQPVVPGVVLIHILKDLCSKLVGTNVELKIGTNIKFLNIIDPQDNTLISISGKYTETDNKQVSIKANILKDDNVHLKFMGVFSY